MEVFNIVLPAFLIVILGYVAKRLGYLPAELAGVLSQYFLKVSVPAIIIASIAKEPIGQLADLWLFFVQLTVIFLILFFITMWLAKWRGDNLAESSFFALSSSFSNAGMLALPILYQVFGLHGMTYAVISVIVSVLICVPVGLIFVEYHKASGRDEAGSVLQVFAKALWSTVKTPYVIGAIIGLIISGFAIPLPKVVMTVLNFFAATTVPVALFAVGMDIELSVFKRQFKTIFSVSCLKLIVMPLMAIATAYLFNLSPQVSMALLICCAVPTAKSVFVLAKAHHVAEEHASAAVVGTTVLAMITVTVFVFIGHTLWPSAFAHVSGVSI